MDSLGGRKALRAPLSAGMAADGEAKPEILPHCGPLVRGRSGPTRSPLAASGSPNSSLIPCVLLRKGEICLPSADGPVAVRNEDGGRYDPFEVVDKLVADYPLVYLVDLDGIERAEPQLDFLQELARDAALWVDGGVRTADQAIDILITGAQRAVLSSAMLRGFKELRRSWRLSTEFVFEVELDHRGLVAPGDWEVGTAVDLVRVVREVGVDHFVLSPREVDPDWELVRTVSAGGPTWVDGSFEADQLPQLRASGARGGIFHLDRMLGPATTTAKGSPLPSTSDAKRDDET